MLAARPGERRAAPHGTVRASTAAWPFSGHAATTHRPASPLPAPLPGPASGCAAVSDATTGRLTDRLSPV
jgi:hypothetical protein